MTALKSLQARLRLAKLAMVTGAFDGPNELDGFVRSLASARQASGLTASAPVAAGSVAVTVLMLTWLNPHVYLDTVLMLGSVTNNSTLTPCVDGQRSAAPARTTCQL